MKAILTNYRYYVLLILIAVAITGLFAVPADKLPKIYWLYTLVSTKLIAFATGYIIARLYNRWKERGTIPELIKAAENY